MERKRYIVIGKIRMQTTAFTNNPDSANPAFNIVVDLENHPQKDKVQIDWFYDEATNTFSAEGEVIYPEVEYVEPEPTQLDRMEEAINKSNEELRNEGADALTLELIERGLL